MTIQPTPTSGKQNIKRAEDQKKGKESGAKKSASKPMKKKKK